MVSNEAGPTPAARWALLRNPAVLLFLAARLFWQAGAQINNVAVGWLVYDATRSALALGFVGLAAFAPKVVVSLVAGLVADRYDRRFVLAAGLGVNALASLGLVFVAAARPGAVAAVYALWLVSGTARGFVAPASQALGANLVDRRDLGQVFGLSTSVGQLATIAGPAAGGLLLVPGAAVAFAGAALCFAAAAAASLAVRPKPQTVGKGPVRLGDAFAGLRFIRRHPVVLAAISLDLFCVLLGGATALLPIIARDVLLVGPFGLGLLRSAQAAGAMSVALVLASRPIRRRAGAKLLLATAVFGLATVGLGLSRDVYASLGLLWVIGAADVVSVVIRQTLVQGDTPDAMRGRVSAVNALFIGASNELGEFESGTTAAGLGLVPAIVLGGAGTIAVTILWALVFPDLRRRDRLVADAA